MSADSVGRRVAILGTRGIPARYGGFETFAEELAVRLVEQGVEVTVYCEAEQTDQPESCHGVKLVYIPSTACGPLTTILFDLRCLWHARKSFDLVYMLGYGAAPFCLIPRLYGTQVWLNVDGIEWARAKWSGLAKAYFKMMEWFSCWVPHRVIADAEGIKTHLEARHRLRVPCSVIPYGAPLVTDPPDVNLLSEFDLLADGYHLVVARLEPENNIKEIIEGFVANGNDSPLIIVGNYNLDTPYTKQILSLSNDKVHFVGGVYDKQKLQALRYYSTAYFHGHSVGGTNPSLLEALGCGNIVIAHDNVYNREVCGAGGFYFSSPHEIPGLMAEVSALESAGRRELKTVMQNRIRERYNWDQIAAEYMALLDDL